MSADDVANVRKALESWSKTAIADYGAQSVYLFGSLVYKDGEQFMASSDADLVVVMLELATAPERWRWLQRFSEAVADIEIRLLRALRRSGAEPSVSIAAVTDEELAYDVHKDGHREFFTSNVFRDLATGADSLGLPGAGSDETDRFVAGALAFTQKLRNDFLAVSANGTPRLVDYEGSDPLPKRVMRAAAMAARASGVTDGPGAEHDVKEGLDLLTAELYRRREDDPSYRQVQDLVSVGRLGRGRQRPVEPPHQLLLAEMVYDLALRKKTAPGGSDESRPPSIDQAGGGANAEDVNASEAVSASSDEQQDPGSRVPAERMGSSTAFFARRFADAFPGVRSIEWFTGADDIEQRMLTLLKEPLSFPDGLPVWYWRGGNLQIENFRKLEPSVFLMDTDELRISRVAAIHGSSYKRHFVYVRCDAMSPTGLYHWSTSDIAAAIEQSGYCYEEFGLVSGITPITRAQYDDGAAVFDGKLTDVADQAELRVRYITPYNFLIAANGSPINNNKFDFTLVKHLNEALQDEASEEGVVERLHGLVEELPLRAGPYQDD